MPFVKGKSGNPTGRPKRSLKDGRTLTDIARDFTDEAFGTLCDVLRDDEAPHAVRVSAASAILDRGWGKATQMVGSDPINPLLSGLTINLVKTDAAS